MINYFPFAQKKKALCCIVLYAFLFTGCATKQVISPSVYQPRAKHQHGENYRRKAAYNRPYKVKGRTYYPMNSAAGYKEFGIASWYGSESGNKTAMGTRFRPQKLTAAHKTLPLPSKVRVTNLNNGRSVDVLVNDRGPFKKGRLIDLSKAAASKIGVHGLAKVKVEYIGNSYSDID